MDIARRVTIVASAGSSLGVAIYASLVARGWSAVLSTGPPPGSPAGLVSRDPTPVLAVLEDDRGTVQSLPRSETASLHVCVGSIQSISALITLAGKGVTVLNQAAPFLVLLNELEQALLSPSEPAAGQLAELIQRQAESAALASLTPAENDALLGMMAGLTAAEIAVRSHRSVHTIRSQIKAVLAKLGVPAQIAAVAIAHRSGHANWLGHAAARFHQFW